MSKEKQFNMETVSIAGFCSFCKNNLLLILAVSITLFFTYGIKLFWYSIGIDTELFMADKDNILQFITGIGRFVLVFLLKFFHVKEFNPFTEFFSAFLLIWLFTVSWCYIIAVFGKETVRNNKLIPFALVFMTSPVWAEQFYFVFQATETAFMIGLCPYVIYLLYKGFLDCENGKIVSAFILLVVMTAVYQAIIPLFCCGVFLCFILLQEHSQFEPVVYRNLCIKLFVILIGALALYFLVSRIIVPSVFHIERSDYLDGMNRWGEQSIKNNILAILSFGYTITIGHLPQIQSIVNPIIAGHAKSGILAAEAIARRSKELGNILLLPGGILFLVGISARMKRIIPSKRRPLYLLAGIGIPLSIIFLSVMGGGMPPFRSLYSLPLASSFMFFYLIKIYKKKIAIVIACLVLLSSMYQAQITAQLFYSDHLRYDEDVRLALELDKLITQVQPNDEKLPVALIGRYQSTSRLNRNFFEGEVMGHSVFEWSQKPSDTTERGLFFMQSLGIYFDMPDETVFGQALLEATSMPAYPEPGCVKRMPNYIVVRISENLEYANAIE